MCGILAYIIYGLNIDLCPQDRISYPYAADIDGQRVPVQREQVSVFGQIYSFDIAQAFFTTQNLNLTTTFQGMEIGSIFDDDTSNACADYDLVSSCSITSTTGLS